MPARGRPALIVAALLAFTAGSAAGQQRPLTPARIAAAVDSVAGSVVGSRVVGMSVVVARGGAPLLAKGYGQADREAGTPVTAQTVFQIGSVTKQFTAAGILRLVEEGRVALDSSVAVYLPEFADSSGGVTIRRLLNHTSGVRSYTSFLPAGAFSQQQVYDSIRAQRPDFAPGADFRYNNSGYFLLGLVLERVTGRPYAALMREWFFEPLGMEQTGYCGEEGHPAPAGYRRGPAGYTRVPPVDMRVPYAAGALCATGPDLARWMWALVNGRVVSPESYGMMIAPGRLAAGDPVPYGFGLAADSADGRPIVSHGGGIPGFVSDLMYLPDDSTVIVVLVNTGTDGGELSRRIRRAALGMGPPQVRDLPLTPAVRARPAHQGGQQREARRRAGE